MKRQSFQLRDFSSSKLNLGKVLHAGKFSNISTAHYSGTLVVVKQVAERCLQSPGQDENAGNFETKMAEYCELNRRCPSLLQLIGMYWIDHYLFDSTYTGHGEMDNEDKRDLCLVYEYAHGGSILKALADVKDFLVGCWWFYIKLGLDLAQALDALHSNGLIHGAIQSSHTLVDKEWCCKLSGFGLIQDDGTCNAPELAKDGASTMAADVYGFGILLSEILLQEKLEQSDAESKQKQIRELLSAMGGCPPSVIELCLQCIDLDPDRRPAAEVILEWLQDLHEELTEGKDTAALINSLPQFPEPDFLDENVSLPDTSFTDPDRLSLTQSSQPRGRSDIRLELPPRRENNSPLPKPNSPRGLDLELSRSSTDDSLIDLSVYIPGPFTPEQSFSKFNENDKEKISAKKKGFLVKRSHKGFKRYKKYWFTLRFHELKWFKDGESQQHEKGCIKLEKCILSIEDERNRRWNWRLLVPNQDFSSQRMRDLTPGDIPSLDRPRGLSLSTRLSSEGSDGLGSAKSNSFLNLSNYSNMNSSRSGNTNSSRAGTDEPFIIYEFGADSAEDRESWMALIQSEIDAADRHRRRISTNQMPYICGTGLSQYFNEQQFLGEKRCESIELWLRKIGLECLTRNFTKAGYFNLSSLVEEGLTDALLDNLDIKAPLHRRILSTAIAQPSTTQMQVDVSDVVEFNGTMVFDVIASFGLWESRKQITLQEFMVLRDALGKIFAAETDIVKFTLVDKFPEMDDPQQYLQSVLAAHFRFQKNIEQYLKDSLRLLLSLQHQTDRISIKHAIDLFSEFLQIKDFMKS